MSTILFAGTTPFVTAHGGAHKANRILGEQLAARGHAVHVVALARRAMRAGEKLEPFLETLVQRGTPFRRDGAVVAFEEQGVHVEAIDGASHAIDHVAARCRTLAPDVVIVSSEDWRQRMLAAALEAAPGRVLYQGRTLTSLPFGAYADNPHPDRAALVCRAAALVAPCSYYASYMRAATGLDVEVIHNVFLPGAPRPPSTSPRRFVTLVNPCALKGLPIFLALADALPSVDFAAVPTWGTSAADLEALARVPNVQLLPATDDVDVIYDQTRVLLAPSLGPEGISNVVVEAMLHGIPVLASDHGGLPEATQGAACLLPIHPIERFRVRDGLPIAIEMPEQDATPWIECLRRLLDDDAQLAAMSERARHAATSFARGTSVEPYERLFDVIARANVAPAGA